MNSPPNQPRLCILAYSPVARDARVLRQARALADSFRVVVAGFGANPFEQEEGIEWFELDANGSVPPRAKRWRRVHAKLARFSAVFGHAYCGYVPHLRHGWHFAQCSRFRVILCNDVDSLPAGVAALERNKSAKLVLDLHEYPTRDHVDGAEWRSERLPWVTGVLKRMAHHAAATFTVADSFAPLMQKEFRMRRPEVIYNAPYLEPLPERRQPDGKIRYIHHGVARQVRELDRMIDVIAGLDERHVLHFMLSGGEAETEQALRRRAEERAPGRVFFEPPVAPDEIVQAIARYDVGLYLLPPYSFNAEHAMPNKFFDFIVAGLPVAVSPSVNMAKITRERGVGWVADDYTPAAMIKLLSGISDRDRDACRQASMRAREDLNAEKELEKLVRTVRKVAGLDKSV